MQAAKSIGNVAQVINVVGGIYNNVCSSDREQLKKQNLYSEEKVSQLQDANTRQKQMREESETAVSRKNYEIDRLMRDNTELERVTKGYKSEIEKLIRKNTDLEIMFEKKINKLSRKNCELEEELRNEKLNNKLNILEEEMNSRLSCCRKKKGSRKLLEYSTF